MQLVALHVPYLSTEKWRAVCGAAFVELNVAKTEQHGGVPVDPDQRLLGRSDTLNVERERLNHD